MRKKIKQMMLMLLVGILLTGSAAVSVPAEETEAPGETTGTAVEADTTPVITLKKQDFTIKTSIAKKKAIGITTGETIVKMPSKGKGYLKFKAPKKGTYKFSFSDLTKKKGSQDGYINLQLPKKGQTKKLVKQKVKSWGGKTYSLWLGIRNKKYGSNKAEWTRTVRNAKVKLKKGQVIYIFFSFAAKDTVKVKVGK